MWRDEIDFFKKFVTSISMEFRKRKNMLIKYDISWDVDTASGYIKTFEAFVHITVRQKTHTFWNEKRACVSYKVEGSASTHNQTLEAWSSQVSHEAEFQKV